MINKYIIEDEWKIIEEGFKPERVESSESIFSLGNGAMGQRANFEEDYSGQTFQGSYIGGIYYPDKTRVGWWKNGYPEYFAKVLNAPNWIGIHININGIALDLNTCKSVEDFRRELNMQTGIYTRSFKATLADDTQISVVVKRFLLLDLDEVGVIDYSITPLNKPIEITCSPYIEADIHNQDSNWNDAFWTITKANTKDDCGFVECFTNKTEFHVCTFMQTSAFVGDKKLTQSDATATATRAVINYKASVPAGESFCLQKLGGYTVSLNHPKEQLVAAAEAVIAKAKAIGIAELEQQQSAAWQAIWNMADIKIEGDTAAQQGIRFNIFQLNQTYSGKDARLNIGPKGFTGEKYGGSTYWDTEAYCLPFYMATKGKEVARNLLVYRYNQLEKAIENAQKLGFKNGAALYPMVTMNGEECHNEWEITFEEIHRNGAIFYAILNYARFTGDYEYIAEKGLETMIAIARFWAQRVNYSRQKSKYVILGVTGPNEYENNVNNNWYTNYLAKWCLEQTHIYLEDFKNNHPEDFMRIRQKVQLKDDEAVMWKEIVDQMYLPYDSTFEVYLQQDNFLDKEIIPASELDPQERPINQHWSWDRILRSCYIKQADVLQGFYFFESHFSKESLERHFDFYEPLTVHESSLSPCVHAVLAASINRLDKAYEMYLRTSRLDLDDYNKEVKEGLHITSMAGTWMSIVEGFGGLRIKNEILSLNPQLPKQWKSLHFKINYRSQIIEVKINNNQTSISMQGNQAIEMYLFDELIKIEPNKVFQT